jgi:hypothetical protein
MLRVRVLLQPLVGGVSWRAFFPIDGGTQVDLTFAGDKYRVW